MKKVIVFMTILFVAVNVNAQFFAGVEAKMGTSNTVTTNLDNGFSYFAGINAGYEFLKHVPVSIGIEYGELNASDKIIVNALKQTSLRIPLKAGYCHYFGKLKPFINIGTFYALKGKMPDVNVAIIETGEEFVAGRDIDNHFGILGQIGVGYKLTDKITVSAAYEYNRPFDDGVTVRVHRLHKYKESGYYYSGAVINASIYF
jgi:outer membrane protein W